VWLRIGTSGWNYPTGRGTWNGICYPLPENRQRGFDELAFYAERFNVVEVNSTFYGQPRANAAQWWDHDQAEDRDNYYYSGKELEPIVSTVRPAQQAAKKAYLLLNNHFSAQAVANATTLKKMLDDPVTVPMPAEFIERFPDLAGMPTLPRARLL